MAKEKRLVCINSSDHSTQSHDHHAAADYDYEDEDINGLIKSCSYSSQYNIHLEDSSEFIVVGDRIGLKSTITPDFLRKIQDNLQQQQAASAAAADAGSDQNQHKEMNIRNTQVQSDEVVKNCKSSSSNSYNVQQKQLGKQAVNKAENFIANSLIIGSWQWHSKNKGDLIGKCYYAKKKLVWEIIHGSLKSKIEFNWSNIIGITSYINQQNQLGVFEVELNEPPKFYKESEPQPRKHTIWIPMNTDFTGMQATLCRRHKVMVLPSYVGELNKLYDKLLDSDPNLLMLSQMSFSTQNSPYFNHNLYQPSPFHNHHNPDIFTHQPQNATSAMPVMNNQVMADSESMNWDQGMHNGFDLREDDGIFSDFGLEDEMLYSDNQLPQNDHLKPNVMMSSSFMENCDTSILFENTSSIVPYVSYPASHIVSTNQFGNNDDGNYNIPENNLDYISGCYRRADNNIENQRSKHQHEAVEDNNHIPESFEDVNSYHQQQFGCIVSDGEDMSNSSTIYTSGVVEDDNLSYKDPYMYKQLYKY